MPEWTRPLALVGIIAPFVFDAPLNFQDDSRSKANARYLARAFSFSNCRNV
jgi:hypothetical protein